MFVYKKSFEWLINYLKKYIFGIEYKNNFANTFLEIKEPQKVWMKIFVYQSNQK